ncbi:MAG: T9SS type A sorting domain-containing protein [Chlorobi bacterium]|nr:T9SS type A sorting domain-containing protein [Chlorobiota bacterium]
MRSILLIFLLVFNALAFSQIPDGYYDDAEGLGGDELKAALHDIIDNHVEYSYNDLRDFILKNTDEDPDNANNVILLYTGRSQAKSTFGGGANDWNREHVWAKSHGGFGNNPPCGTDAHHIRPTDASVNSERGNLDFDEGGTPLEEAPGCKKDGDSFEPRDEVKGDVARMIFYMAVRYEGSNGEPDLEVVDYVNTSPEPEMGKLQKLLDWNMTDPPDDFEKNRNEVIYSYQENRNPFIDHPEYVDLIWGDPNSREENLFDNISVYPNPFESVVNIDFSASKTLSYSILSFDGKTIASGKLDSQNSSVNLTSLNSGIYLLFLQSADADGFKTYKLIKQ